MLGCEPNPEQPALSLLSTMSRVSLKEARKPGGLFYFPAGGSVQKKAATQSGTRSKRVKRRRRKKKKAKPKLDQDTSRLVSTSNFEERRGGSTETTAFHENMLVEPAANRKAVSPLFIPNMGLSRSRNDVFDDQSEETVDSDSDNSVDDGRREFEAFLERKLLREKAAQQRREQQDRLRGGGADNQLPGLPSSPRRAQIENRKKPFTSKGPRAKVPDPKEQSRELDAIRRSYEDARRVSVKT